MNGVSYREQLAEGAVMAGYGICEVLTEGNERLPAGRDVYFDNVGAGCSRRCCR